MLKKSTMGEIVFRGKCRLPLNVSEAPDLTLQSFTVQEYCPQSIRRWFTKTWNGIIGSNVIWGGGKNLKITKCRIYVVCEKNELLEEMHFFTFF